MGKVDSLVKTVVGSFSRRRTVQKILAEQHVNSQLHFKPIFKRKSLLDNENEYAHFVLESSPKYLGYLSGKEKLSPVKNVNEKLWNQFVDVMNNREMFATKCDQISRIADEMRKSLSKTNDDEIENILEILRRRNELLVGFKYFYYALNDECVSRLKKWNVQRKLLIADYIYSLKLSKSLSYNFSMVKHLKDFIPSLTFSETVQLMFYINLQRECPQEIMKSLEKKIESCLSELSSEEISIVAMAFFKTQTVIESDDLMRKIIERFLNDISTLGDVAISAYGKLFRHSNRSTFFSTYVRILDKCAPMVERWHPSASLNLGLLTTTMVIDHREFIDEMIRKMLANFSQIRLKELCNLLSCVSMFGYEVESFPNFYSIIIQELRSSKRQEELLQHPVHLVSSLLCLAYHEIFPLDLIRQAFEPKFYNMVKSKAKYDKQRDYFVLDSILRLEVPSYDGNLLNENDRRKIWLSHRASIPLRQTQNLSHTDNLLLQVRSNLSHVLGGYEFAKIIQVLPHFRTADIVVHLNNDATPNPINHLTPSFEFKQISPKGHNVCFVIGARSFYTQNTRKPLALTRMKIRHLKKLGYKVVEIPWFEYTSVHRKDRNDYVKQKLEFAVQS